MQIAAETGDVISGLVHTDKWTVWKITTRFYFLKILAMMYGDDDNGQKKLNVRLVFYGLARYVQLAREAKIKIKRNLNELLCCYKFLNKI